MDETGVLSLLEELIILLDESKPVFGKGNLRQVDIDQANQIIDEIREAFPSEFESSRRIVREREALLADAEAEAHRLVEDARLEAITIASEQEVVRVATLKAHTIESDVEEYARQTRAGAEDYADDVFGHVEQSLEALLSNVRRCRDRLNTTASSGR